MVGKPYVHVMAAPMPMTTSARRGDALARNVPGVVRMLMALTGTSSKALAEYLGLHPNRMSERMTGKKAFELDEVVDLADFFEVSFETLLRDPDEVRARVQNWKLMSGGDRSPASTAARASRHLTPVASINSRTSDPQPTLPLRAHLRAVE